MDAVIQQFFQEGLTDPQADDLLVLATTNAMTASLAAERLKGKGGWHTTEATNENLKMRIAKALFAPTSVENLTHAINLTAMLRLRLIIYEANGGEMPARHHRREQSLYAPGPTGSPSPMEKQRLCSICREPQFHTAGGWVCKNGHGGADPIEGE